MSSGSFVFSSCFFVFFLLYHICCVMGRFNQCFLNKKNSSQSCLTMGMAAAGEWLSFTISEKEWTTINCPLFISYKFDFQSLSKCSCRQPQCLGYGVPLCYNILPSLNRITITSSSEIASMLHGTYPRRYVFSSSLSIACCMRLVSFSDLLL